MNFVHQPVLLNEIIEMLQPKSNQDVIDCTVGGGGHSYEILKRTAPNGKLIGIDLDPEAIKAAKEKLKEFGNRLILINDNYKNIKQIVYGQRLDQFSGIILDLGVSSFELEDASRGFSFKGADPLDMRMGQTELTAAEILNHYKKEQLARIFKEYGEERYYNQIADLIVEYRKENEFKTTDQLVELIENYYQKRSKPKIHVATKVFQALRIEVNQELENLKTFLPQAMELLKPGGRIAIISFHSLEDRIVKEYFKQEVRDCICPPKLPVCQCNHKAQLKLLTKKPIVASPTETANNPRSRSAKLRVAQKT